MKPIDDSDDGQGAPTAGFPKNPYAKKSKSTKILIAALVVAAVFVAIRFFT